MGYIFLSGFALGFSLILAIGAQNAFVLKQGLIKAHVFWVCLVCAASDAILIAWGIGGLGQIIKAAPWVIDVMRYGGVAFLFCYGMRAFLSAWKGGAAMQAQDKTPARGKTASLIPTLVTCIALTWLNPHVYLDTVILLGSIANQSPVPWIFGAGAGVASFAFFFSLGYGARLLVPLFAKPRAWQVLDFLIGLVMWSIAIRLLLGD